jgi:hypothetical protein
MVGRIQVSQNLNQFVLINPGCKTRVDGPDDLFTGLGIGLRQNEGAKYKQNNDRSYQSPLGHGPLSSMTKILTRGARKEKPIGKPDNRQLK